MAKKRRRTSCQCLSCKRPFVPDVRSRGRQKYCPNKVCRAVGKALRQQRWASKKENRDYFKGPDNAARVRAWQRLHPHYWKNTSRYRLRTLQDVDGVQVPKRQSKKADLPLQDALRAQDHVLVGLIAHVSESTLQEDIAFTARRLLQIGQQVLANEKSHGSRATGDVASAPTIFAEGTQRKGPHRARAADVRPPAPRSRGRSVR
jgi:hypothetical protein